MLKVVGLEGGPCGGKTTAVQAIEFSAHKRGINTVHIPEVASQMLGQLSLRGINFADIKADELRLYEFEKALLAQIIEAIESVRVTSPGDTLILVDRVDIGAYITRDMHMSICNELGFNEPPMNLLVDTVLYFPTLAKHDPGKYDALRSTNKERYETAEQAIATCNANFATVRNHPDFWLLGSEDFSRRLTYAGNIALRGFRIEPINLAVI